MARLHVLLHAMELIGIAPVNGIASVNGLHLRGGRPLAVGPIENPSTPSGGPMTTLRLKREAHSRRLRSCLRRSSTY